MKILARIVLGSLFVLQLPLSAHAASYKVDPSHTSVTFEIRHLFTTVRGQFKKFDGQIVFDTKDSSKVLVEGSIDAASIDTNVEKRDTHLRSKDFFDVATFPKITFKATRVSDVSADGKTGKMEGDLTIRGITKPVVLDVAYLGEGKDPWGNMRAGFRGETTFNRKDFGIIWNETLETGGLLLGEEVKVLLDVEGIAEVAK